MGQAPPYTATSASLGTLDDILLDNHPELDYNLHNMKKRGKTMERDIVKAVKQYKERHPEIDDIMEKFQMSQEAYDKALASIGIKVQRAAPTYTLTTKGRYNVNVSKSTR